MKKQTLTLLLLLSLALPGIAQVTNQATIQQVNDFAIGGNNAKIVQDLNGTGSNTAYISQTYDVSLFQSLITDDNEKNDAFINQAGRNNMAQQFQIGLNNSFNIDQNTLARWTLQDQYIDNNLLRLALILKGIITPTSLLDPNQYSSYFYGNLGQYFNYNPLVYYTSPYGLTESFEETIYNLALAYGLLDHGLVAYQNGISNTATQTQNGFKNHASILQVGNFNQATQSQDGNVNFALTQQNGKNNKASVKQQSAYIGQTEYQWPVNFAFQYQDSGNGSVGNKADIDQHGLLNRASQVQIGDANDAYLRQMDSFNTTATQVQLNNDGFSSIVQNGTMNSEAFVFQAEGSFDATTVAGMNLPLYQLPN